MTEAFTEEATRRSPLDGAHRRCGATLRESEGYWVASDYGDRAAEYWAVRARGDEGIICGLLDLSARGLIEVSGSEAVQFLNGLVTNDVKALPEGAWMAAAFPNVQGRLLALTRVLHCDGRFLFDTEAATREIVLKTLERFTLAGDFHVRDLSEETALISLQGRRSAAALDILLGEEEESATGLRRGAVLAGDWRAGAAPLRLIRATHTSEDGFDIFVPAPEAEALWDALREAGARPVGFDALEVLRVEAGVPRYGSDLTDANVVLEAAQTDAVSFTKGCYVGQEIIARIHWRGHVAKRLAGLVFDANMDAPPPAGARVTAPDGKEIGRITSSVLSPHFDGRPLALGMLKYDYLAPTTQVRVVDAAGEEGQTARVTELPPVRGSWYEEAGDDAPGGGETK